MHKRTQGFTLIELLVVIAIIAILAAILFPVFAQAKNSAKKAASISNQKQISLGAIMYSGDADDMVPMHDYILVGGSITSPGGNVLKDPIISWVKLAEPYVKNWPIYRDPGGLVDPLGAWGSNSWWRNWMYWPEYGLNTGYLNPAPGDCSQWGSDFGPGFTSYGPPISMTSIASPAGTVFFTTTKVIGTAADGAYPSYDTESPAAGTADDMCTYSDGGWGANSYGDTPGQYPGNPTYTGTFATHYADGGIIGMTDGSAKYMKPGKLAAGTNWRVGISNAQVVINDRSQYVWDTRE